MSEKLELSLKTKKVAKNFITVREAAAISSYTTAHVTRLAQKGSLVATRSGRQWLIDSYSLQNFLTATEEKKSLQRQKLREERVNELTSPESSLKSSYPKKTGSAFHFRAFLESAVLTLCFILVSTLLLTGSESLSLANLVNGAEKVTTELSGNLVPKNFGLKNVAALNSSAPTIAENLLSKVWCNIKLLWYRTDECASSPVIYAVIPAESPKPDEEKIVNNSTGTNIVREINYISNPIIREIIIKNQGIDTSTFVTYSDYQTQTKALIRSIEGNSTNLPTTKWNTAYGWGDHSTMSYLNSLNGIIGATQSFATSSSDGLNIDIASSGDTHTFTSSLVSGYNIPLTASTTAWENKVSSQWTTSGSDIYYNTGNVGIGTSTPTAALHVYGTAGNGDIITVASSSNTTLLTVSGTGTLNALTNGTPLVLGDGTNVAVSASFAGDRMVVGYDGSAGYLRSGLTKGLKFQTDGANTWLYIDTTGNVGIGSTTPSSKLTVVGNTWIGGNLTATGTLNIAGHSTLTTASSTALTVSGNSFLGTVLGGAWQGGVITSTFLDSAVILSSEIDTSAKIATIVTDETGSGELVFATSPTLVTPILGTPTSVTLTNATGLPVLTGISGLASGIATWLATSTSANLIAVVTDETGTGNLVFSNSPTFTGNTTLANASTTNLSISGNSYLGTVASGIWNGSAIDISSYTNLTVGATGLELSGDNIALTAGYNIPLTASTTAWENKVSSQWTTSGSDIYYNTGNVGIGTTNPGAKLDINISDATAYSPTGLSNNVASYDVAQLINSDNTTGDFTSLRFFNGKSNGNAVGRIALINQAGGDSSLAFLFRSSADTSHTLERMRITSTGNVGIGTTTPSSKLDVAGFINTSGTTGGYKIGGNTVLYASSTNFSTLVGQGAGTALLADGLYNTALGYEALKTATSSNYNTAVGYGSLYSNTTGYSNTANGLNTLSSNTTGSNNIANGVNALYSNTTGYSNTANGVSALYFNTTGNYNTTSGYLSGYGVTTGSNNILLGASNIVASYDQVTTGSNNIAIGYNVAVASSTTSNQLNIGNLIYGTGLNGTGATLSTGNIGIGTTTPLSTLTISGSTNNQLDIGSTAAGTPRSYFVADGGGNAYWDVNRQVNNGRFDSTTNTNGRITMNAGAGSGYISFATTNTNNTQAPEVMRITGAGNVGIGTVSPSTVLQVNGAGNAGIISLMSTTNVLDEYETIRFGTTPGTRTKAEIRAINTNTGNSGGALAFLTNPSTTLAEAMRITSSGNVGIGTTTPAYTLETFGRNRITGADATNNAPGIWFREYGSIASSTTGESYIGRSDDTSNYTGFYASGWKMIVTDAGNVGIGTTSPGNKLTVGSQSGQSNANISARAGNANSFEWGHANTAGYGSTIGYNSSNGAPFIAFHAEAGTTANTFQTRGKPGAVIQSNNAGGLTIGTVSTASADNQTLTSSVTVLTSGNVGIGDTTPAAFLTVGNGDLFQVDSSGNIIQDVSSALYDIWIAAAGGSGESRNLALLGNAVNDDLILNFNTEYDCVSVGGTGCSAALDVTGSIEYTGTITDVSDERLKENISPLASNLEKLSQLNPVSFNMIGATSTQLGFLAQNVQAFFPDTVSVIDPVNGYLGLDYTQLIAPAIGAIQELNQRTEGLYSNSGNVGIGTTSPATHKLQVAGSVGPNATNSYNLGASGSNWGCLYYNSGTLGTCASDESLKTDIKTLSFNTGSTTTALDKLATLKVRSFAYKTSPNSIYHGLIAQEVERMLPELVVTDPTTSLKSVKYGDIQWLTLEAVQELNANIESLTASSSLAIANQGTTTFAGRFWQKVRDWLGDKANGIGTMIAGKLKASEQLCVGEVCVNEATFLQMVQNAGAAYALEKRPGGGGGTAVTQPDGSATSTPPLEDPGGPTLPPVSTSTPPVEPTPEPTPTASSTPAVEPSPTPPPTPTTSSTPPAEPTSAPTPATTPEPVPQITPTPEPEPAPQV